LPTFTKLIHADTKTKFMTFLTGAEVLEVNVTVAVEAAIFLSLTCLLVFLCRSHNRHISLCSNKIACLATRSVVAGKHFIH